jgi:hypothetical protein
MGVVQGSTLKCNEATNKLNNWLQQKARSFVASTNRFSEKWLHDFRAVLKSRYEHDDYEEF